MVLCLQSLFLCLMNVHNFLVSFACAWSSQNYYWFYVVPVGSFRLPLLYIRKPEIFIASFSNLYIYILPPCMWLIYTKNYPNWSFTFEMRAQKEVLTSNIQTLVMILYSLGAVKFGSFQFSHDKQQSVSLYRLYIVINSSAFQSILFILLLCQSIFLMGTVSTT